jgi:hypothetical protein
MGRKRVVVLHALQMIHGNPIQLFSKYVAVTNADFTTKKTGYIRLGFPEVRSYDGAEKFIRKLDGYDRDGYVIKVKLDLSSRYKLPGHI